VKNIFVGLSIFGKDFVLQIHHPLKLLTYCTVMILKFPSHIVISLFVGAVMLAPQSIFAAKCKYEDTKTKENLAYFFDTSAKLNNLYFTESYKLDKYIVFEARMISRVSDERMFILHRIVQFINRFCRDKHSSSCIEALRMVALAHCERTLSSIDSYILKIDNLIVESKLKPTKKYLTEMKLKLKEQKNIFSEYIKNVSK
jgi:hypothetical protein